MTPMPGPTLLNENEVATIIQEDGYRLWGNRTCSGPQVGLPFCAARALPT